MQRSFSKKKIFIWGTGRNCQSFLSKYKIYFSSPIREYQEKWENNVIGFIDKSVDKIGTIYHGKRIVAPDEAIKDMDYCIITVADNMSIVEYLRENGFTEEQWVLWDDYIEECKKNALLFEEMLGDQQEKSQLSSYMNIYNMLNSDFFNDLRSNKMSEIIAALEWRYDRDIDAMQTFVDKHLKFVVTRHSIKTIGIVIDRLYGGGIEKVVALLLSGFSKKGYKVVLLTDPTDKVKEEYEQETIFHFSERGGNFSPIRLDDLESAIHKYDIDVLCFHTGYARADSYYEVLLAKMLGIFVTMEIHTAFIALLKDQINISSQFIPMYRLVDRLVTISETDDAFFKCMGCKSTLIENPIETFGVSEKTERIKNKGNFEILWVGRIVQQPKRVLDAVEIIKLVHEKISNVRLHIIGMRDNEEVYKQLIDKTNGIRDCIVIDEFKSDIKAVYESADVVLMTSASESFSNVLAEAKVLARPVVMYKLPWLRLAYDNTGVWSVKQRDIIGAAEAIICLLQDDILWNKYSDDAWNTIQLDMNRDVVKEWKDMFETLENNQEFNSSQNNGVSNAVRLLLDQMYEKGYPDY